MNNLILAVLIVVISSYFTNPLSTAAASEHHSVKHASAKTHTAKRTTKVKHHSRASKSNQRSIVSWYGSRFHGRKTASGERYNMYAMTAAHKTLPLLSYAQVTNLKNHRSVIVRITDRGPFHGNRAMDVSYAAAKELGIKGTGSVKITPLRSAQALSSPQS
jgi:rare lipoprotein A